jgi:hypothetical protein
VGETWEALKRAEQECSEAGARAQAEQIAYLERLTQDVSAARVSIHALEDRIELELGALRDELPQNIAKLAEQSANRARVTHEELRSEIAALADASWRLGRRWNAVVALIGLAALVQLLRC